MDDKQKLKYVQFALIISIIWFTISLIVCLGLLRYTPVTFLGILIGFPASMILMFIWKRLDENVREKGES